MRDVNRGVALLAMAALLTCAGLARAETESGAPESKGAGVAKSSGMHHEMWAPHHGKVASTKSHRFETLYSPTGIEIYAYNADHSPVTIPSGATGTATIKLHDGTEKSVQLALATDSAAGDQSHLVGTTDAFAGLQGPAMVTVQIKGLDGSEKDVTFRESYQPKHMRGSQAATRSASPSKGSSSKSEQH